MQMSYCQKKTVEHEVEWIGKDKKRLLTIAITCPTDFFLVC